MHVASLGAVTAAQQVPPRQIAVALKDGVVLNCAVTLPWLDWMQQLFNCHGILFEDGWIPIDLIKHIAPARPQGSSQTLPDNVVSLFKR